MEVATIAAMVRDDLVILWRELLERPVPRRLSTPLLRRIVAWELQARRHGGLAPSLERTLDRLARGEVKSSSPWLRAGGRLIREWNGVSHVVDVTPEGFAWRGRRYRSLSAIAREITGAQWSGPRFFGLRSSGAGPNGAGK